MGQLSAAMRQQPAMAPITIMVAVLAMFFHANGVKAASQLAHAEAFPDVPNPNVRLHLQRG